MEIILTNTIIPILALLLGGLNILQLFTFRSYKRKQNSEADLKEIESLRNIIELNQSEVNRLYNRYDELNERYDQLEKKYIDLRNIVFNKEV